MQFARDTSAADQAVHSDREFLPFPRGGVWSLRHDGSAVSEEARVEVPDVVEASILRAIDVAERELRALSERVDRETIEDLQHLQFRVSRFQDDDDPPRAA